MNEEEKNNYIKPIGETLQDKINYYQNKVFELNNLTETQQKELDKKDKIIDLMAKCMYQTGTGRYAYKCMFKNKECNIDGCERCIIDYFTKKVEE